MLMFVLLSVVVVVVINSDHALQGLEARPPQCCGRSLQKEMCIYDYIGLYCSRA